MLKVFLIFLPLMLWGCLPRVPQSFLQKGRSMTFQRIEKGSFVMGSPRSENYLYDEKQVKVTIPRAFEMMTTEVTQMMWFRVMKTNPSYYKYPADCDNHLKFFWQFPWHQLCPDHPVEQVSWNDIQVYIQKLNEKEGRKNCQGVPKTPRMLSPAHPGGVGVCRQRGTTTAYFFGDATSDLKDYACMD